MAKGKEAVPENFIPFGYPLADSDIPDDIELAGEEKEFLEADKWSLEWGEMWRDLAAFGIVSANAINLARELCKREIRAARNYAREGNVEMAERYIARLEKVYPVATGKPLTREITDNMRKKYPR